MSASLFRRLKDVNTIQPCYIKCIFRLKFQKGIEEVFHNCDHALIRHTPLNFRLINADALVADFRSPTVRHINMLVPLTSSKC